MSGANSDLMTLVAGIFGVLIVASVIGYILQQRLSPNGSNAAVENLNARIKAWWVMVILIGIAFIAGRIGVLILFGFCSFAALREFVTLINTRRADHWALAAAFFVVVHEYQYGNHIYTEKEPVKVVMDEAAWTSALDKFIDITKAAMPPGLWSGASSDNPKEIFTAGQAVAYMSGSWQIAGLADNAHFTWQAGPTPRGTVASSIYGGDYIVAFNTSQHLPEAIDFIKWVTSPDIQAQYAKTFGMIPANLKAAAVKYDNPAATEAIKAMQAELNAGPAYAATDQAWPQMQAVWGTVKTAVTQAVAGQISSAEAISQIKKAADASLEAGK